MLLLLSLVFRAEERQVGGGAILVTVARCRTRRSERRSVVAIARALAESRRAGYNLGGVPEEGGGGSRARGETTNLYSRLDNDM